MLIILIKMKNKKISVITVTWNRVEFLEEAIISVMNQKYENFEHIIIDNASSDGTVEMLKKYPHLIWLSEPDKGQSDAMNKGLKLATGDIFAWLNDDDLYPSGVFDLINKKLDLDAYSFAYGVCDIIGAKGKHIGRSNFHRFDRQRMMLGHNNVNTPAVFASIDLIRQVGLMDESLFATFDLDMWIRLSLVKPPLPLREVTSLLRLHGSSGLMSNKVHLNERRKIRLKYKHLVSFRYKFIFDIYLTLRHFFYDRIVMKKYSRDMNF